MLVLSRFIIILTHKAFKPCIDRFNYCKSIIQVDEFFLIGRYARTLLAAIGQDDISNMLPLALVIVEGETKEVMI
ncbi:hypothetical protein PHAVU_008G255100 [Phaseolus vulgaris]|uniref:MULE transposase domain-containing protein n=1 Tax=Phaseolus vulgaris TaxID=3885 RepID=V7BB87_PHAVU|nr:hypothetical protein PHAVU_008G255100g [Phaseolus vulgaris]ESW14123.1 hypothetical protein PHAVU_008G255100g [Phaseolus vulgaris]